MGNFNKFGGGRNGGGFGGKRFGGGRGAGGHSDGQRQMFQVTCSKCGNECEVPFRPTGDRPVFCNNCFKSQQGSESPRFAPKSFGGGNAPTSRFNESNACNGVSKAQIDALSAKLDKILAILAPAKAEVAKKVEVIEESTKKSKTPAKKTKSKKK